MWRSMSMRLPQCSVLALRLSQRRCAPLFAYVRRLGSEADQPSDTLSRPKCASAAFNPANDTELPENPNPVSTLLPEEPVATSSSQNLDSVHASSNYSQHVPSNGEFPQYMAAGAGSVPQYPVDAGGVPQYPVDAGGVPQYPVDAGGVPQYPVDAGGVPQHTTGGGEPQYTADAGGSQHAPSSSYMQPPPSDDVDYSECMSPGVSYSQPPSGDAISSQSTSPADDFSQFDAASPPPLPNTEWSGGLIDESTPMWSDPPLASNSSGMAETTNIGTDEPPFVWNEDKPNPKPNPVASPASKKYEKVLSLPISIIERERSVIHMLKGASLHYKSSVVPRISGGWIRDKILNRNTAHLEMDVSIDRMSGHAFGRYVRGFIKRHRINAKTVKILKDRKNFENMHLRTTMVVAFGIEVAICCLRKDVELHDGSSSVALGTPTEDAHRRDFTINSLFYNTMTHQIEDFTGLGLDDLRAGLIRTPTEAFGVMKLDPLRVLRALRLAIELDMRIDTELEEAIHNPVIHEEMRNQVSPSRFGTEIAKVIELNNFSKFASLMKAPLFEVVFPLARTSAWTVEQANDSVKFLELAEETLENSRWEYLSKQRKVFLVAALFLSRLPLERGLYSVLRRPVFRHYGQPDELNAVYDCIVHHLGLSDKLAIVVCRVLCGSVVLLGRIAELEAKHERKFHDLPIAERLFDSREDVFWFRYLEKQWPVAAYLANSFYTVRNHGADESLALEASEKLFDRLASSPAARVLRWRQIISGTDLAPKFKGGAIAKALDEAHYLFAMNPVLTKDSLLAKVHAQFALPDSK